MAHRRDFPHFANREAAGLALSALVGEYARRRDVVVLGLPRGGVPVALVVARGIAAPLDICLVRKIAAPWDPELALGAIASGGVIEWNELLLEKVQPVQEMLSTAIDRARQDLVRGEEAYRAGVPALVLSRQIVIVVDDGLATGASMRAAVISVSAQHPAKVVVAVPVGPRAACTQLELYADEVICARMPDPFVAVGDSYIDFRQVDDAEVRAALAASAQRHT